MRLTLTMLILPMPWIIRLVSISLTLDANAQTMLLTVKLTTAPKKKYLWLNTSVSAAISG